MWTQGPVRRVLRVSGPVSRTVFAYMYIAHPKLDSPIETNGLASWHLSNADEKKHNQPTNKRERERQRGAMRTASKQERENQKTVRYSMELVEAQSQAYVQWLSRVNLACSWQAVTPTSSDI